MIQKIFKESFLYTFANHAPLLVNIIILPIITPYLTANDYGIYGLTLAYTGVLSSLADLGFTTLFQNTFFKEKKEFKKKWSYFLGVLTIWKIVYALINVLILWLVFKSKIENIILGLTLLLIAVPIAFFDLTKTTALRLCQYTNNHKKVYVITFITSMISIGTTFLGVYYYRLGYMSWFISSFIVSLIQFIYFFKFLHITQGIMPSFNFPKNFIKDSFRLSMPLIPINFSGYLLETSDRIILDVSKLPVSSIGQYNLAYSFSNYFKSFNNAMNTVLSPLYFSLLSKKDAGVAEKIKWITYFWFGFILFISFFLCLWLKEIFGFLYRNESLNESYKYAIFIIMGFTYQPFFVASLDRAIYYEKSKSVLKVCLVAGILNLILNIILIPYYGIIAAILSTFISYLLLGFYGFFERNIRQYILESYNLLAVISSIIFTGVLVFLLKDIEVYFKALISFFVIFVSAIFWIFKGQSTYLIIKNSLLLPTVSDETE